jgi:hypothetical protein
MREIKDGAHPSKRKLLECSICHKPIEVEPGTNWAYGHNAQPVNDGRCCSDCNSNVVIPTRLKRIYSKPKYAIERDPK